MLISTNTFDSLALLFRIPTNQSFLYFALHMLRHLKHQCSNGYYPENVDETPEDVLMELIARFGQTIMRAREDLEKYVPFL